MGDMKAEPIKDTMELIRNLFVPPALIAASAEAFYTPHIFKSPQAANIAVWALVIVAFLYGAMAAHQYATRLSSTIKNEKLRSAIVAGVWGLLLALTASIAVFSSKVADHNHQPMVSAVCQSGSAKG